MGQLICILGRQPALGLAELESLFGTEAVQPLGLQAALVDVPEIPFKRLGGSIKLAKVLTVIDTTEWGRIEKYLLDNVVPHTQYLPAGKMSLGLSVYGLSVNAARINATGLSLKKRIKTTGRSVRVVPNKTPDLNSAQVLHNDLTGNRAWELLFVRHGKQTYLAQTTNVQDINAYAARDQARPKRDARVGMLPPKLAQIIINLAIGQFTDNSLQITVLDPFCGTGVVLQEAMLMGFDAYGTDLEQRMIDYSQVNLEWLTQKFKVQDAAFKLAQGDAISYNWFSSSALGPLPATLSIACETYLGRPFSAIPAPEVLQEVMHDVNQIHKKFLQNVAAQTKPGFRMCIAVPAWKTKYGFTHLKMLDNLGDLGYTRSVFKHVDSKDLLYHRPEQIVARELIVLTRT